MRIFASLVATIYVVVVMSVYAPDDWHGILFMPIIYLAARGSVDFFIREKED